MNEPADIRAAAAGAVRGRYAKGHREALVADVARALLAERLAATERAAKIASNYKRDASFDDSMVGALEHNANQMNIAAAIRSQP